MMTRMETKSPASVSIVMPAHNEEGYLDSAVREITAALNERLSQGVFSRAEVIVVENGSADRTAEIGEGLAQEIEIVSTITIDVANYGAALRAGFLRSTSDIIVNFDVDYYDIAFLDKATELIATTDADVVVGSKRTKGAEDTRPWPRRLVTATFATVLRLGFGLRVSDTHGMKAMRREPLLPLVHQCLQGTDLFDTELIIRAERGGRRVVETPVRVEETRPSRSPIAKRVARTLFGLAKLRINIGRP